MNKPNLYQGVNDMNVNKNTNDVNRESHLDSRNEIATQSSGKNISGISKHSHKSSIKSGPMGFTAVAMVALVTIAATTTNSPNAHGAANSIGQKVLTDVGDLIYDNVFSFIEEKLFKGLKVTISKKSGPITYTVAKPFVSRTTATFDGEFWDENQRISKLDILEVEGELIENQSIKSTGFLSNTNQSGGGTYAINEKFTRNDLLQGDDGIVPPTYLDGQLVDEEDYFRDRRLELHHHVVGRNATSKLVAHRVGNQYTDAPEDLYTHTGKKLQWNATYKCIVDHGRMDGKDEVTQNRIAAGFNRETLLPVTVFYHLADINIMLKSNDYSVKELQLHLIRQQKVKTKKTKYNINSSGEYGLKLLSANTQLLRNQVFGTAIAYPYIEKKMIFLDGPMKRAEEVLDAHSLTVKEIGW